MIILDWDDTMFPTSWTIKNNIKISNKEYSKQYQILFEDLDKLLSKMLTQFLIYGKVYIVTNGSERWIKSSIDILPNTKKIVESNILVISSRDIHKDTDVPIHNWKNNTFKKIVDIENSEGELFKTIISIGDAEYEYNALLKLNNDKRLLKSVKLMKSPTYNVLIDQLKVLSHSMKKIIDKNRHLEIMFKNKKSYF